MGKVILPAFLAEEREAVIIHWFYEEGAKVEEGSELLEILADAMTYKVVADTSGILKNIQYQRGDVVPFFEKLADIEENN